MLERLTHFYRIMCALAFCTNGIRNSPHRSVKRRSMLLNIQIIQHIKLKDETFSLAK